VPGKTEKSMSNLSGLLTFLLGLLFDPEDERDIFLWDVGELPNNMVLQPRRLYSL
jgi:hypothetical protein